MRKRSGKNRSNNSRFKSKRSRNYWRLPKKKLFYRQGFLNKN